MSSPKVVKDLMISIFDLPHIPYWFSVREAIKMIRVSFFETQKYPEPLPVLVFDEKFSLMGTLTLKDILEGLEPRFLKPSTRSQLPEEDGSNLTLIWDTLFTEESKELANRPVNEVMVPARVFVEPQTPISKAAYLMLRHNLILLPVLEEKKKFVGLVRMVEIFHEISHTIVQEQEER